MNLTTGLSPDYSTFTIDDFELTYDALSAGVQSCSNAICQPRATLPNGRASSGSSLVQQMLVEPGEKLLAELIEHVRGISFADRDEERRRRLLLVRFETEYGDGEIEAIVALLARQADSLTRAA